MSRFGQWVKSRREEMRPKVSQSELARRVEKVIRNKRKDPDYDLPRDRINKLELLGIPEYPDPEFVAALAECLGRPLREALEALGYEMPVQRSDAVAPGMNDVLAAIPWETQERLAVVLPGLMGLAQQVAMGAAPKEQAQEPPAPATEDQMRAARAERVMGLLKRLPDDEFEKAIQKMEEEFDPTLRRKGEPHFPVAIPKTAAS